MDDFILKHNRIYNVNKKRQRINKDTVFVIVFKVVFNI